MLFLNKAAFWQLQTYDDVPILLDDWQIALFLNNARLIGLEKAPQIGFSWGMALSCLHDCLFYQDVTDAFVSVNLSEAQEKILYARKAYEQLPEFLRREVPLIKASESELWFGAEERPSRLISLPATASMRGRTLTRLVLDEADFYKDGGEQALRIMLGRVARGGQGIIGSTCFGVGTVLDKVCSGSDELSEAGQFSTGRIPWDAAENPEAKAMALIAMKVLTLDQFDEEYGCIRGTAGDSFSPELIHRATDTQQAWELRDGDLFYLDDEDVWHRVEDDRPMVAGYDVGQTRNPSILSLLVREPRGWVQRALIRPVDEEGQPLSLPAQQRLLDKLLEKRTNLVLCVDAIGIGAGPAEALLEKWGPERVLLMVAGADPYRKLPARVRRRMTELPPTDRYSQAVALKVALEGGDLWLTMDDEQSRQLQQTRLLPGHLIDQPGSRRRTHYDRFWSLAYAWWGVTAGVRIGSVYDSHGLIVVGGSRPPASTFREALSRTEQRKFLLRLMIRLQHGEPIPWQTLADEEAMELDELLGRRAGTLTSAGRVVDAAVCESERARYRRIKQEALVNA